MLSQPCTDIGRLLGAADDARSVIAMSLLPDAARALTNRLALGDEPDTRRALTLRLQALNVHEVFWDDGLEEAQLCAEARELLERMQTGGALPLLLSGCSGWYRYVSTECAALCSHFNALTPHVRRRGLAIRSLLSASLGVPFSRIIHVTVVPCEAQKERYSLFRDEPHALIGEEYVITVRELALWLGLDGALPVKPAAREQKEASAAGRLQRVLGMAEYLTNGQRLMCDLLELTPLEERPAVRTGIVCLNGRTLRCAQVRGLHEAQALLPALQSGEWRVDLLEVLACVGCR